MYESYLCNIEFPDSLEITMGCWDTASSDEFYKIRKLTYSYTEVFMVIFSVVDKNSL